MTPNKFLDLNNILSVLAPEHRIKGKKLVPIVLLLAIMEMASVASLIPFLSQLGGAEGVVAVSAIGGFYDQAFGRSGSYYEVLTFLGVVAFLTVLTTAFFRVYSQFVINRFIESIRHNLSQRLLTRYLYMEYIEHLGKNSADLIKTSLSEVDQFVGSVVRPIIMMISHLLVLLAILALLVYKDPVMALSAGMFFAILYLMALRITRPLMKRLGRVRLEENEGRFRLAQECLQGIKAIKADKKEDYFLEEFIAPSSRFSTAQASYQTLVHLPKYFIEATAYGGLIGLTLVLVYWQAGDANTLVSAILPTLGVYGFSAYKLQPALQGIFAGITSMRFGSAGVVSILDDLNLGACPEYNQHRMAVDRSHTIRFSNVRFRYPDADEDSLSIQDLQIPIGATVGLVGASGCGKTTFVDLLLGLLTPAGGTISIGCRSNSDISQINADNLTFGYVPQNIYIADRPLIENIGFGLPVSQIDVKRVIRCIEVAQLGPFLRTRMHGDVYKGVGESGSQLSGGQRQRIGVARALYRNPDVLVLDEATSALDVDTEAKLIDSLHESRVGLTTFMIAHRPKALAHCTHLLELKDGRVDRFLALKPHNQE